VKGYYFITDSRLSIHGDLYDVTAACRAGVEIIQYRQKHETAGEFFTHALELKKLCKNSIFIINDRLDIALAVDADGLHIGQDDLPLTMVRKLMGPDKIVGVTVHSLEEAVEAQAYGASYLAVSPVFATDTKSDAGAPCGPELIQKVRAACSLPIAAIGGLTMENAAGAIRAGADMFCAISAVVTSEDVSERIKRFQELYYDTINKR
jgi:thiamine-phosphate pyrophosphorylase